ncbi:MAG TPA: hypothetical protein VE990_13655 [Acidimicrobiales bacterium]|nr:hypothetical protein [Acidimicrobiales bacterium]
MANLQLEYSWDEILADPQVAEPLRVGDLVCHGGFDSDGQYRSPRTRFRPQAIAAWQENHRNLFGTELLEAPLESWPGNYPNLDQARLLLREGVRDPIIAALTRIGTVEGFGAMIRYLAPEDMQKFFAEDLTGTATAHLGRGLVEAHARDEAGWEEQAGHNRMWFAVRDIAFENPVTADQTAEMLARMGIGGPPSGGGGGAGDRVANYLARRVFDDLDVGLEMLISTMLRVMFIEIKAFHVFAWAEALLSDDDLVAGEGQAARIVSYIRADETPHVEYLRTSLSEMRDRTFLTDKGSKRPGAEVIGTLWERAMAESRGPMEEQNRTAISSEVARALSSHAKGADLLEEFHSLGEWRPAADAKGTGSGTGVASVY